MIVKSVIVTRADAIHQVVMQRMTTRGYSCQAEVCLKRISKTAHARIGIGKQCNPDGSIDLPVSVGVYFPELKKVAEELALPVRGSVAWTATTDISELASASAWSFEAGEDPASKVDDLVNTIETLVRTRLVSFSSYETTIQELESGFPCLWSQKRLVIPLALLAQGDRQGACKKVKEFSPKKPVSEAQEEYVRFARHFSQFVCQELG